MVGFQPHLRAYADGLTALFVERGLLAFVLEDFGNCCGEIFYVEVRHRSSSCLYTIVINGQNVRLKWGGGMSLPFDYGDPEWVDNIVNFIADGLRHV